MGTACEQRIAWPLRRSLAADCLRHSGAPRRAAANPESRNPKAAEYWVPGSPSFRVGAPE
jgi:hypothetical protein